MLISRFEVKIPLFNFPKSLKCFYDLFAWPSFPFIPSSFIHTHAHLSLFRFPFLPEYTEGHFTVCSMAWSSPAWTWWRSPSPPPWQLMFWDASGDKGSCRELEWPHDKRVDVYFRITDIKAGMILVSDHSTHLLFACVFLFSLLSPEQYETIWSCRPLHRSMSQVWGDGGQRLFQYPFWNCTVRALITRVSSAASSVHVY